MIKLHMKINGHYVNIECDYDDIVTLEKVKPDDRMFVSLGGRNYNARMIEYWWVEDID